MEGLFVKKSNNLLSASTGDSKLSLLASLGGLEVMKQVVYPNSVVWVTPAEDKETVEIFYVLNGSVILMPDTENVLLESGDSFYADGLKDEVFIKVVETTTLLYITNKPLFNDVLAFQGDLEQLMKQVDGKDNYTYQHSMNVLDYSVLLFRKLRPIEPVNDLTTAALFHDVGKCLVPDEILKKPGRLTDDEFLQMMKHPTYSARLLRGKFGTRIADIAKAHHERLDGSGYPYGLTAEDIPYESKIIAVADAFDAMTTKRVYRNYSMDYLEAAQELFNEPELYDREITTALVELVKSGEINKSGEKK